MKIGAVIGIVITIAAGAGFVAWVDHMATNLEGAHVWQETAPKVEFLKAPIDELVTVNIEGAALDIEPDGEEATSFIFDGTITIHNKDMRLDLIRKWGGAGEVCEVYGHRWQEGREWEYTIPAVIGPRPEDEGRWRDCEICGRRERRGYCVEPTRSEWEDWTPLEEKTP